MLGLVKMGSKSCISVSGVISQPGIIRIGWPVGGPWVCVGRGDIFGLGLGLVVLVCEG